MTAFDRLRSAVAIRALVVAGVATPFISVAEDIPENYPANYAKAPRFNALVYYSDKAEEAHVQFAEQSLHFIHKLSYGEGFTYRIVTSLASEKDSLENYEYNRPR